MFHNQIKLNNFFIIEILYIFFFTQHKMHKKMGLHQILTFRSEDWMWYYTDPTKSRFLFHAVLNT